MTLLALGINHKTAPVSLRERVTFSPDTLDLALDSLLAQPMVQGGVVLSTCNRTELYLSVEEQDNLHEALIRWLCDYHNLNEEELRNSLYWHQDNDAVSHLMRVASGLDSLVLGEPQILGQVKKAFADSQKGHLKASECSRSHSPWRSVCEPKPTLAPVRFRLLSRPVPLPVKFLNPCRPSPYCWWERAKPSSWWRAIFANTR
jgi:hypothetical protein